MTKKYSTKKALISSILILCMCFSMLLGTTFAWFTDDVTAANNVIQTGTLKVGMYWADGTKAVPAEEGWTDASTGSIFNNDKWEPGYVEVRHIKIANEGTLALKYKVNIIANGEVSELADVIDVYYIDPAIQVVDRAALANAPKLGTLTDVLENLGNTGNGALEAGKSDTITIALMMQESAGNEYMDLSIGTDFSIQILATQYTYEADSFDNQYDDDANYVTSATTLNELFNALDAGIDAVVTEPIVINDDFLEYVSQRYESASYSMLRSTTTTVIDKNVVINGNGSTIFRSEDLASANIFTVNEGFTLTLIDVTVDGGAIWSGPDHKYLARGTENIGMSTTGAIVSLGAKANLVLGEGAVIQNNDGASAISLATRGNGVLTIDGGEIINNHGGGAGAIWGGGAIVLEDGKINGNSGGIGGVVRSVDSQGRYNVSFTMNGGEVNHNYASTGGVIWSGNGFVVNFNGGEVAYNGANVGSVIWGGSSDKYYITGDFEMHHNESGELCNAIRMNHYKYPYLEMTGGKIYDNDANGLPAIYAINDTVVLKGGVIEDDILYTGGVGLTMGKVEMSGIVHYDLSTNHNTAYLDAEFNAFKFTVAENTTNFSQFNFKPAEGYVYTEGDEAKLICMNEGYSTYWDAATKTFKLKAD